LLGIITVWTANRSNRNALTKKISIAYRDLPGNVNDFYALRVKGNSMIDEGIFNSDIA